MPTKIERPLALNQSCVDYSLLNLSRNNPYTCNCWPLNEKVTSFDELSSRSLKSSLNSNVNLRVEHSVGIGSRCDYSVDSCFNKFPVIQHSKHSNTLSACLNFAHERRRVVPVLRAAYFCQSSCDLEKLAASTYLSFCVKQLHGNTCLLKVLLSSSSTCCRSTMICKSTNLPFISCRRQCHECYHCLTHGGSITRELMCAGSC